MGPIGHYTLCYILTGIAYKCITVLIKNFAGVASLVIPENEAGRCRICQGRCPASPYGSVATDVSCVRGRADMVTFLSHIVPRAVELEENLSICIPARRLHVYDSAFVCNLHREILYMEEGPLKRREKSSNNKCWISLLSPTGKLLNIIYL